MEFVLNEYHRNTPDEELIEDVKRVADLLKKESLSCKDYSSHGRFSYGTLRNRFGSWNEVLRRAGLSVEKGRLKFHDYCESDEVFFADLRRVAKLMGRGYVTRTEYEKHGRFNYGERTKKYGGWGSLLKVAGLEQTPFRTGPKQMYSEKELFEEIERVWIKLGRQPSSTDFEKNEFKYGRNTFLRRFGGWRKALEAFVDYINSEDDEEKSEIVPEEGVHDKTLIDQKSFKHKTKRDINLRLRFKVMARDHFKCCKCGKSPATDPSVVLHIDHIYPYSKGGETIMENLQTLCSDCNLGKSDLVIL
jgi:5-methylcytosine-specific restriction endonuclease McrA